MKRYNIIFVKNYILEKFRQNNIDDYESNYLLAEVLNCNINDLILVKDVSSKDFCKIKHIVKVRIKGKPLTKIFKKAYFYGLEFFINNNVLSCRQETELIIDAVINNTNSKDLKILDLCCGSGCIGITLKSIGFKDVTCADISKQALRVTKKNAKLLNQEVKIVKSDLFENINEKYDIIVSNPPYIRSEDVQNLDIEVKKYDPIISLDGGVSGLDFYNNIIKNLGDYLNNNGFAIFEIGYDQANDVKELLNKFNFNSEIIKDYSNNDRIIIATRR